MSKATKSLNSSVNILLSEQQEILDQPHKVTGFQIVVEDPHNQAEIDRIRKQIQGLGLNLSAFHLGPGLYYLDAGEPEPVEALARRFEPGVPLQRIPPRLGDRLVERFVSDGEVSQPTAIPGVLRIREVWES